MRAVPSHTHVHMSISRSEPRYDGSTSLQWRLSCTAPSVCSPLRSSAALACGRKNTRGRTGLILSCWLFHKVLWWLEQRKLHVTRPQ